jgi:cysteine desulfurase
MPDRSYLDWNATAPLRREAREAMAAAWDLSGNPSSVHAEGRHARRLVEEARAAVARAAGALPRNVVFTSGGTEANALALTPGLRRDSAPPVERLLVSAIEHASVLAGGRFATEAIGTIGVTSSGLLDLDSLRELAGFRGPGGRHVRQLQRRVEAEIRFRFRGGHSIYFATV